ncbi:MAG: ATP synthase subunit I [Lachnospiraceae bacterium]|nr:ATP synthase subunit I [Lachnospiraceae bacterium]
MDRWIGEVQPAVKKETRRVTVMTATGIVIMWILFAVFHVAMPESVPFDYTVFLGGFVGGLIAVLNFFLMGLMVQSAASAADEDAARTKVRASYSQRLLLQMLWVIAAIVAPCFQFVAGIVPLFLPSFGIKLTGIIKKSQ